MKRMIGIRRIGAILGGVVASLLIASSAMAHECVNASKVNQDAGVQVVIGMDGSVVWVSQGVQARIEHGVIDFDTGEGFHGLIGFDMDGDGAADIATYIVGPEDEIPWQAQARGPDCRGITNIGTYLEQCLGG